MLSEMYPLDDLRGLSSWIVLEVLFERGLAGGPLGRAARAELEERAPMLALQVEADRRRSRDEAMARMRAWGPPSPASVAAFSALGATV